MSDNETPYVEDEDYDPDFEIMAKASEVIAQSRRLNPNSTHRSVENTSSSNASERASFLATGFGLAPCPTGAEIPICPPACPPAKNCIPCVTPAIFNFLQLVSNSNKNAYLYTPSCYLNAGTTVIFNTKSLTHDAEVLREALGINDARRFVTGNAVAPFNLPSNSIRACELELVWTTKLFVQNLFVFDRVANDDCARNPPFLLSGRLVQFWGWPLISTEREHAAIPKVSYLPWVKQKGTTSDQAPSFTYGKGDLFAVGGQAYLVRSVPFQMVLGSSGTIEVSVFANDPKPSWVPFATGSIQGPIDNCLGTAGSEFSMQLNIVQKFKGFIDVANCFKSSQTPSTRTDGIYGKVHPESELLFTQSVYVEPCTWLQQTVPVASANEPAANRLCPDGVSATAQVFSPQSILTTLNELGQN